MRGLIALLTAALILVCAWLILLVADPVLHVHTGSLKWVILVLGLLALLGAVRLGRRSLAATPNGTPARR